MATATCSNMSSSSPFEKKTAMVMEEKKMKQIGDDDGYFLSPQEQAMNAKGRVGRENDDEWCLKEPRMVVQQLGSELKPLGEGFALRRTIGRPELESLDPFLTFDEFEFSHPAGFPDHPHRGFETVTYMLEGGYSYHDFSGHKGTINAGDVQWMTAGRGVVHTEMPGGDGVQRGLVLWINLSSKDKMVEPRYQELASHDIPHADADGVAVKVIAGEALGVRSPIQTRTRTLCLDVTMQPGARLHLPVSSGWSTFAYTIAGEAVFGSGDPVGRHHCVVFGGDGSGIAAWNRSDKELRFLLVAAPPHGEAVVMEGPFVMNTREEVEQAREDYRNRRNGFEMAENWSSGEAVPVPQ